MRLAGDRETSRACWPCQLDSSKHTFNPIQSLPPGPQSPLPCLCSPSSIVHPPLIPPTGINLCFPDHHRFQVSETAEPPLPPPRLLTPSPFLVLSESHPFSRHFPAHASGLRLPLSSTSLIFNIVGVVRRFDRTCDHVHPGNLTSRLSLDPSRFIHPGRHSDL